MHYLPHLVEPHWCEQLAFETAHFSTSQVDCLLLFVEAHWFAQLSLETTPMSWNQTAAKS